MKARYRYRIDPTNQQKTALAPFGRLRPQLFGCVRVAYNDALALCKELYTKGENKPSKGELSKRLTQAKKTDERKWLSVVSSVPLQQAIDDLETAYKNFFQSCKGKRKGRKVNPPKFKRRKSAQAARFTNNAFKVLQDKVFLAKVGELEIIWSRPLPSEPSSLTVIKDSANRYFLSFVVEINPVKLHDNGKSVGIDLGIIDFASLSTGDKIKSPKPLKKNLRKLRRLQKNLSRKQKGSKRHSVARLKVGKLYAKIADTRNDFLHKLSTKIIRVDRRTLRADLRSTARRVNQTIILEDLNISGMMKNRKLSRAISDLGWRSFRTMLSAKAEMYGRDFRVIDRWEPTSQRCSCCGQIGGKKELNVREWTCLFCGAEHDRDLNAAINILVAGKSDTKVKHSKTKSSKKRKVAEGHSETQNGRGENVRLSTKVADFYEASTTFKPTQLSLF